MVAINSPISSFNVGSACPVTTANTVFNQPRPVDTVRVLHVINGEHYSGAERVQDLLAARLADEGFEVGFACVKRGKFPSARKCTTAPLYELHMRSKLDLRVVHRLVEIAREGDYSLLHAHTPRSLFIARAASFLSGIPLVYHVHSPTSRDTTHAWRNRLNHLAERIGLTGVHAMITVSESLRRHMVNLGYADDRVIRVPNGVPAPAVVRDERPPGIQWELGMSALFRPRKGLEMLLEALVLLRRREVPVRLRAIGAFESPEYEREIKARVAELEIEDLISWRGFTTDVDSELATLDLFVLPSLFGEGLPMVVLEAMAAGVPVVATNVEGVPEAIEDGVNGVLTAPSDSEDLALGIERVVRGDVDWSQVRRSAMRRHAEHFSDKIMAARVADVYRRVLK